MVQFSHWDDKKVKKYAGHTAQFTRRMYNTFILQNTCLHNVSCGNGILQNHCCGNGILQIPATRFNRFFFSASPRGNVQLSKLSIGTKFVVKMVFCTIIVVIMLNPFSKDNSEFVLHCSLLRGSTDFFFCLSKGKCPALKTVHWNEGSCENGILHSHCSGIVEPIFEG